MQQLVDGPRRTLRPRTSWAFLAAGALLCLLALLTPSSWWETAAGREPGTLSWGPVLFRGLLAVHGLLLGSLAVLRLPASSSPQRHSGPSVWLALVAISAVAFALRLYRLDSCLWLDEILTYVDFARLPAGAILTTFPNQNQHMLYSLLAHGSFTLFGESAWSLRLPSVLFGVGSLWALFLLGRKLVGVWEALLACALMTVSYHHIWFSQNARGYMGLLCFTILSLWLWLEALERQDARWFGAYALAAALGLWLHLTMLFVLAGQAVAYAPSLLRGPQHRRWWLPCLAWMLTATLALQMQALALPQFLREGMHEVSMPSDWTNPLWLVTESLRSLRIGFAGVAVLLLGGTLAAVGFGSLLRRAPQATLSMVLPALLGGGAMLALGHNLWPRFFFFSMGFALLIVIHGGMRMLSLLLAPRWAATAGVAFASLLILTSAAVVPRCYALPKQDYLGARTFVQQTFPTDAPVAVVGLAVHAYGKLYAPQWTVVQSATELQSLRRAKPDLILVYTLPTELKAFHPALWQVVEQEFAVMRTFPGTLGGGEVYVSRERSKVMPASVLVGKVGMP